MGKIGNLIKRALRWYFEKYAECYDEKYYKYTCGAY